MFTLNLLSALSTAALLVSATPFKRAACDTSAAVMDLPSGQTALVAPTTAPLYVLLGAGIQNYTCGSASTFASIGAVASLFDISCLIPDDSFADVQTTAFNIWDGPSATTASSIGAQVGAPSQLGLHYFVTSPSGTGISPKWDFSTSTGDSSAASFVIGAKTGDIAAPTDSSVNVDWLYLTSAEGSLASKIFRIDTVGGQPPSSCTPGDAISVKYTAKYYLY